VVFGPKILSIYYRILNGQPETYMLRSLLITLDFPPRLGGVANYWSNLLRYLPAADVVVLAPEMAGSLAFDRPQNYLIYRQELISRRKHFWPRWWPFLRQTMKLVRAEKIQRLLVAEVLPGGLIALVIKKIWNIPYIVSCHGLDIRFAQKTAWHRFLLKRILREATHVIVNSHYTGSLLVGLVPDNRQTIIYPCPNIDKPSSSSELSLNMKKNLGLSGRRLILSVGRLVERKGFDQVLRVFPELRRRYGNVFYAIVGRGPDQTRLESLIREHNLSDAVRIFGDISDEQLVAFYEMAEIFVMPSRELENGDVEGFGIVYLEANAFGLPVIGGRSGGVPEAVVHNQNGLLVDPVDANQLLQACSALLDNLNKRQELARQGARRLIEEYNWTVQGGKLFELLNIG
jgi:phosphatidylinositol alpha-1,6-mannosyltransferase